MWKWFRWILLMILILIILILIVLYCYYFVWMKMGAKELNRAKEALAHGFTLTDSQKDFVIMGSNKEETMSTDTNNQSPYSIDYLDIKAVQVGADDKYIYYKVEFYGDFPKWPESINGDRLINVGTKMHIMNEKGIDQIVLHADFGWEPVFKIPASNCSYDYCNTGVEWPEEARMSCHGRNSKVAGGAGTNYILGAMPLKEVGLSLGQKIYISFAEEAKSESFSHASVDVLQGVGKMPGFITWEIGSDKYTIDNSDRYQSGY